MRISDWSSDVCSSDLIEAHAGEDTRYSSLRASRSLTARHPHCVHREIGYATSMMDFSIPLVVMTTATFFAAGTVKGVTGMGLPTVAMGVLGALISPLAAASLLIVPSRSEEHTSELQS